MLFRSHPLRAKTKSRLDEMVKLGVLSKVVEPTEWCGHLVVVPKPGTVGKDMKIRLCTDSKPLNEALVKARTVLPSVEESIGKMAGAKVFSKLDCRDGFWQIPITKKCRELTTFVTPISVSEANKDIKVEITVTEDIMEDKRQKAKKIKQISRAYLMGGKKIFVPLWLDPLMCGDIKINARIIGQKTVSTMTRTVPFLCGE